MGIFNARRQYPSVYLPYWEVFNFYDGRDKWRESIREIPEKAVNLFAVHWLHAEVYNGGFDQYFFNSTGTSAPEAVRGFAAIGMAEVAELVTEAMKALGNPYPDESTDQRRDKLEQIEDETALSRFDDPFYELADTNQFFNKLPKFVPFADRYAARA